MKKRLLLPVFISWCRENKGKHNDGLCQGDFICKHKLHDRFRRKEHVMVCHGRRNEKENEDILQIYKGRCISKQQQLPLFTKDIKLTFHINQGSVMKKMMKKKLSTFSRQSKWTSSNIHYSMTVVTVKWFPIMML